MYKAHKIIPITVAVLIVIISAYLVISYSSPPGAFFAPIFKTRCIPTNEICNGLDDDCDGEVDDGDLCLDGYYCLEGKCQIIEKLFYGDKVELEFKEKEYFSKSLLEKNNNKILVSKKTMKFPAREEQTTLQKKIDFKLDLNDISASKIDNEFSLIRVKDSSYTSKVGEPQIPFKIIKVTLPLNAKVKDVFIDKIKSSEISQAIKIAPAPTLPAWNGTEEQSLSRAPKEIIYEKPDFYPGKIISYDIGKDNQNQYLYIKAFPIQFIPAEETVRIFTDFEITVNYVFGSSEKQKYYKKATEPIYVKGKTWVRVFEDDNDLNILNKMDIDIASAVKNSHSDIIVTKKELDIIQKMGFRIEPLDTGIRDPFGAISGKGTNITEYHTYDSMRNELMSIESNYSSIAKLYAIGLTWENNTIYAMKISDNVEIEENETEFLFTGDHHAREIMTVEIPMYIINYLVENYGSEDRVTNLVNNNEIWFIPMVNPDGHIYVETVDPNWRKNRRDNGDGTFGVDLNRNYGYMWGYNDIGSSPSPGASNYRGPYAFSEQETLAVKNLVEDHEFLLEVDYHAYGEMFLYPWSYEALFTEDQYKFAKVANNLATLLPDYISGPPPLVIYPANGASFDWHYGERDTKDKVYGAAFEINSMEDGGFTPDPSMIMPTCQEHLEVFFTLMNSQDVLLGDLPPGAGSENIIITPQEFYDAALDLKTFHENTTGINTSIFTTEYIWENYPEAADPPYSWYSTHELYNYSLAKKIISFLMDYDSHPNLGYITLMGEAVNVPPSYYWQGYTPSDFLYSSPDYDIVMNYKVGRLPADSLSEAQYLVDKIENWHNSASSGDWFNNAVAAGGRPFGWDNFFYIGEMIVSDSVNQNFFNGHNITKYYTTNQDSFGRDELLDALQGGYGFIYHIGHGSGISWGGGSFNGELTTSDLMNLNSATDVPIVVSISCSNGYFDENIFYNGVKSFGETVLFSPAGGIAYVGGSRTNYGAPYGHLESGNLIIDERPVDVGILTYFFESYYNNRIGQGSQRLGDAFSGALDLYAERHDVLGEYDDERTVFKFVLLGDPALLIPDVQDGPDYQLPTLNASDSQATYMYGGVYGFYGGEMPVFVIPDQVGEQSIDIETDSPTIFTKTIKNYQVSNEIQSSTSNGHASYPINIENELATFLIRSEAEDKKERWFYTKSMSDGADLKFDYWVQHEDFFVNETSWINVTFYNDGIKPALDTQISFYYNFTEDGQLIHVETKNIGTVDVGQEVEVQFLWTPTKTGQVELTFVLNASNEANPEDNTLVYGSWVSEPGPDLRPWIWGLWGQKFIVNQTNVINVSVSNSGTGPAHNSTISFYYSDDGGETYNFLETQDLGTINQHETVHVQFNWTPTQLGHHILKTVANCTGETYPLNNVDEDWVYVLPDGADLEGHLDTWGQKFIVNQANAIEVDVWNEGTQPATNSTASLYYSSDYGGTYNFIGSQELGTIGVDEYVEVNFSWTPTQIGYHDLKLVVYSPDDVNPDNNEYKRWVEVFADGADLYGYIIRGKFIVNQTNTIEVEVYNKGTQLATNSSVSLYYSDDGGETYNEIGEQDLGTIGIDDYKIASFDWIPTEIGEYYLKAYVFSPDDVNLDNNEVIRWIEVKPEGADIYGWVYLWYEEIIPFEPNNISFYVGNVGTEPATNSTLSLYNSDDYEGPYILVAEKYLGTIEVDEYFYDFIEWTPSQEGYQWIKAVFDSPDDVWPDNNEYLTGVSIGPDLTGYLYNWWGQLTVGVPNTIEAYVYNMGSQNVTNASASLYYSEFFDGPYTLIGTEYLGNIGVGRSEPTEFVWTPEQVGEHWLKFNTNCSYDVNPENNEGIYYANVTCPTNPDMVLHLPFNEGSGSVAIDQSCYHNDGDVVGAQWVTGHGDSGFALSFDGIDDYVDIGNRSSVSSAGKTAFTVELWAKRTSNRTNQLIYGDAISGDFWKFVLVWGYTYGSGNLEFLTRDTSSGDNGTKEGISTDAFTEDVWHHIMAVYDSENNNKELWVDGVKVNSTSESVGPFTDTPSEWVWIGKGEAGGNFRFNGVIDEVKIYNKASCSDGTLPGECSSPQPLYCDNGILINNCQLCGCPDNLPYCNTETNECEAKCADGTPFGQCCSISRYCYYGHCVENCLICGCPPGKYCEKPNPICQGAETPRK